MVNNPLPLDLASECKKAAKTLQSFIKPEANKGPDSIIPPDILSRARGLAILTVIKAGFIWSGRLGSGVVIARTQEGGWSAPSAIATGGVGVGGQIGAEMTDFVIILNSADAVKAFSHGGNVTLGGNLSVAAGPVGRNAEAAGTIGNLAPIFSYSKTKGLFAGVSLEGSVIIERKDANATFYHRKISAKEILSGSVPRPPEAADLYTALELRTGSHSPLAQSQSPPAYQPPSYGSNSVAPEKRQGPPIPRRLSQASGQVVALYDFVAQRPDDLSFKKGDVIQIVERTQQANDWWRGKLNGKVGNFPANYVQMK